MTVSSRPGLLRLIKEALQFTHETLKATSCFHPTPSWLPHHKPSAPFSSLQPRMYNFDLDPCGITNQALLSPVESLHVTISPNVHLPPKHRLLLHQKITSLQEVCCYKLHGMWCNSNQALPALTQVTELPPHTPSVHPKHRVTLQLKSNTPTVSLQVYSHIFIPPKTKSNKPFFFSSPSLLGWRVVHHKPSAPTSTKPNQPLSPGA